MIHCSLLPTTAQPPARPHQEVAAREAASWHDRPHRGPGGTLARVGASGGAPQLRRRASAARTHPRAFYLLHATDVPFVVALATLDDYRELCAFAEPAVIPIDAGDPRRAVARSLHLPGGCLRFAPDLAAAGWAGAPRAGPPRQRERGPDGDGLTCNRAPGDLGVSGRADTEPRRRSASSAVVAVRGTGYPLSVP